MSGTEDIRAVVEDNDFQTIIEGGSGRSSSVDYLDTYEDIPKETVKQTVEQIKEEQAEEKETLSEDEKKSSDTEKKGATQAASSRGKGTETTVEEDAGSVAVREEEDVTRIGAAATGTTDGRNENAPVGEWNSLPLLVERLRAALELSLGSRRDAEPAAAVAAAAALPEDSGIDSEEDFRIRSSMEQALGNCREPEIKKDLKFLEDLLLSDIETALSRLKETLERIDVAALARHGAASDPTSKLQLLRLVSSLLSRLQVPEQVPEKIPVLPSTSLSRRRRGTRHTIGVSAEELARARKWFEEERNCLPLEDVASVARERKEPATSNNVTTERKLEEIRDKCTKDAINHRLLEDKNKEIRENCAYRGIQQADTGEKVAGEPTMYQAQYRANDGYQDNENHENSAEVNEERSRVSKLAAALRQRAELAAGRYASSNKFSAKKSKIKRANTIDIPSYLKLQETLGQEATGCISLRKPISVGDKATFNPGNTVVPTFQPKTENDRKFLALINKNNETPPNVPVAPFKAFGHARTMDMSSLTNENWNSRFSNIKTTFDKPSPPEDRENNSSLKCRTSKKFPVAPPQMPVYADPASNYNPPRMRLDTTTGFRHAPSSPFRRIEKSVAPSKVPPSYHRPKNPPVPTNTLKEKARMMFDRESASTGSTRLDSDEKPGFPRPPWLDHERNESKTNNGTVTENGRIDYRSFCKQFAPFVGKNSSPMESTKHEEQRQRELSQRERNPGVVDGKLSFKMIPDNRVQTHRYPPVDRRESRERFEPIRGSVTNARERVETDTSKGTNLGEVTLRGSSSVAVQTGTNDEHRDEGRSFRVAPKIPGGTSPACNNVSVQTFESERPTISVSDAETGKQWKPLYYEQSDSDRTSEDRQRFVLDHNQNYRTVSSDSEFNGPLASPDSRQATGEQVLRDATTYQGGQDYRKQAERAKNRQADDGETQDYSSSFVSPALSNYNQSDDTSDARDQKAADWPSEGSTFLDDQNIQNQDISPEVGVVTRYACAIATVESSVDSPEPRSEEVAVDSRTSSSPSPSQWSWSRSRPPTNETTTPEDEIRRHNMLQQSLVRRLQNEITALNDQSSPQHRTSNYGQRLTVGQSRGFNQSPCYPASAQAHQQTFDRTSTYLVHAHPQQSFDQPANFDQPSATQASNRYAKFLAPIPQRKQEPPPRARSPGPVTVNRVNALRGAYEQSSDGQTKPVHKERSTVANGTVPIDSSDEYLVSCANKPSRSIVLSKSESWHQLALSNSYPRAPRMNVPASTSGYSRDSHPKPPKPRSPSSQKLRSKQYEASSMADSVKKMEDKIKQYFDHPVDVAEGRDTSKSRRSPRSAGKGLVGLSRSRTMPGLSEERLRISIPTPQQAPLLNVNTADVDKVFDDLFEEATRAEQC